MVTNEILKMIFIAVGVIMALIWPFLVYLKVTEHNNVTDRDCEK